MDYTSIKVGQLPTDEISGGNFIPHEVAGILKKATFTDLAAFIGASDAVGFKAVSVSNGDTLPATETQEFILVGPGTYNNVGGGSTITVTEELNALVSNGTYWFVGVEIPIDAPPGNAVWGQIIGTLSNQTDLQNLFNLKADLVDGKVPSSQLPSYVDDVIEVANYAALPATGETGKIYITIDTEYIYRWSGSAYIRIVDEAAAWGTITGTLSNQTDLQAALDSKQDDLISGTNIKTIEGQSLLGSGNIDLTKSDVGLSNVDNTSDANKPVSTAQQTALDLKVPYTGATANVDLGIYKLTASDLVVNHASGSGAAATISKGGNGEALTVTKSSGSGNAASVLGGVTLLDELHLNTDLADSYIASAATWNAKQSALTFSSPLVNTSGTISIPAASGSVNGYLSSEDWTTFNNKVESVAASLPLGSTGGKSPVISIFQSNSSTDGYLSSTDWNTFNGKQNALTNPITGTGTTNYLPKFTGSTALGNSLIYDNGTNVGIGTSSPTTAKLQVKGDNGSYISYIYNNSGTAGQVNGVAIEAGTNSSDTSLLVNSSLGTTYLKVRGDGNVGIGTASPNRKLEISTTSNGIPLRLQTDGSNTGIEFLGGSGVHNFFIGKQYNIGNAFEITPSTTVGGTTFSTPALVVTSGGNVGIGTVPSYKLHISDTSPVSMITSTATSGFAFANLTLSAHNGTSVVAGGAMFLTNSTASYAQISPNQLNIYGSAANGIRMTTAAAPIIFSTGNADPDLSTERMRITSGGNVGIGTSNPTRTLEVVGTMISQKESFSPSEFLIGQFDSAGNAILNNVANGMLAFNTNNTRRMTITSGGDVLVNSTSNTLGGKLASTLNDNGYSISALKQGTFGSAILARVDNTNSDFCRFWYSSSNTQVGSINTNGTTTSYNVTSDYRLKQDFKQFNGLDLVSKIKVYDYEWKSDNSRMNGVIAHELQEVVPYAVTGEKDAEQMQGVDYSKLVPILVQAIQELKAEIEILKNK